MKRLLLFFCVIAVTFLCIVPSLRTEGHNSIILATTTSVQDTGLLDVLVKAFQDKSGYSIKPIAVGTGQALQLGRTAEADILWVHSPIDEEKFVSDGFGINRTTFMHNDFVIIGSNDDPAKVRGSKDAIEAFKKIADSKDAFVSRTDNSGTHKKEKSLWEKASVMPVKQAYIEAGQGMAATVGIANEKLAYCLADRSTVISLAKSIDLVVVFEGGEDLINRYSLILVNPKVFPKINAVGAKAFFDFMLSNEAKNIVNNFGKDKFAKQIFFYDYDVK